MSSAFMAQLPFIGSSTTLGWQNDALAQSYMDHILQRARVLLPRRGWRVGVLKEFYPRGASLLGLNVNAGSEVCVRFRLPGKRNEFLPFHEVLCTALHEFTHCVHSRHDRAFWNLYYDLVKECEALEVTMIQEGKQLYPEAAYAGPTASSSAPPRARGRARSAAARDSSNSVGGQRLGGGRSPSIGGETSIRSRNGTLTATKRPGTRTAGATASFAEDKSKSHAGFPGEGRRLGDGSGLRQYDISPGATPTRDALRRILASAAERRRQNEGRVAALTSPTKTLPEQAKPELGEALRQDLSAGTDEVDEGDVPDHVPVSQAGREDSDGSWKCTRCGFSNEAGVHSCQFCENDEGDSDELATPLLGDTADEHVPPQKKTRTTETTVAANKSPLTPAVLQASAKGTTREDAVEVSDDDT